MNFSRFVLKVRCVLKVRKVRCVLKVRKVRSKQLFTLLLEYNIMLLYLTPPIHEGIRHRMTSGSSCFSLNSLTAVRNGLPLILEVMSISNKMKETFGSSILSNHRIATESFLKVNAHLDEEEKKGLESLIKAAKDFELAINSSNKAVTTLSGLVESVLESVQIRSRDANSDHVRFIKPLELYLKRLEDNVLPDFKAAYERISTATDSLLDVSIPLDQLKNWCKRKSAEVQVEKNSSYAKARGAAYGGASAATLGIAAIVGAANFRNPIGWQLAALAIGSAASIAFGTSATVVEGNQVPKLRKIYHSMLDEPKITTDTLVKKADEDRMQLKVKLQLLEKIREGTEVSKDLGGLIMDETYELIPKFETCLESLKKSCQEYQNINQLIEKEKKENYKKEKDKDPEQM